MSRLSVLLRDHRRWLIVLLLFGIAMVNNLDRQALSVLAPTLRDRLGFGAEEYSYVVTAFLAAYTIGYAFAGSILDRIGVRLGVALALGFWSLAGIGHAVALGWVSLAACRFLLGLGESFNSPAGIKALSEWAPRRERGLSVAIFSNGNILGAIVAPPLVSFLALKFDWHWGFIVTGLAGFVMLWFWWRCYFPPEAHPTITAAERDYIVKERGAPKAAGGETVSLFRLIRHPLCLGFFLCRLLTDPVTYFFSFWLPDYLQHGRGFTLAMVGMVGWLPFLASDIGGPGGGALSDWLVRRGWAPRRARLALMGAAAVVMPVAALAVRVDAAWVAVAIIALVQGVQSCWMANQLTLISESWPREQTARLLALSAMGGSFGGMLSTLLAGRVIAGFGYLPVFTFIGLLPALALGVLAIAFRMAERRAARERSNMKKLNTQAGSGDWQSSDPGGA